MNAPARAVYALLCLLLASTLPGCASTPAGNALEHVVVVWLKDPGNEAHRRIILVESEVLRTIPGVLSLQSGMVVPGERDIVDSSFDVALIVSLTDEAAMEAYLEHPVHVKLVDETLKPLVSKIRVYDFQ